MAASDILQEMIDKAPDQIENIEVSIAQIQSQIDDLDVQITGIEDGMCAVDQTSLTQYMLITKIPELEVTYGGMFDLPFMWAPGPNYGLIDWTNGGIEDWEVLDDIGVLVYKYNGLNWDSDTTISNLISDFSFGNDYLTKPLTGGATYGLIPYKNNLLSAQSLLLANKSKINQSITRFAPYT